MTNEAEQAYRALRRLLREARVLIALEEGGRREKTKADQLKNELITIRSMAARLRVTQAWLRAEADAGRIPCLRAGRAILVNPDAVERALVARAAADHKSNGGKADD